MCLRCLRSLDVFGALPARRRGCRGFSRETLKVSRRRGETQRTSLVGNCFPQETSVMETEALSTQRLVSLGSQSQCIFSSSSCCFGDVIFGKHQNISLSRLDCVMVPSTSDIGRRVGSKSPWKRAESILTFKSTVCTAMTINDLPEADHPNCILILKDQSPC